jgi:spore coat protein CotH
MKKQTRMLAQLLVLAFFALNTSPGHAYEWPGVYDPLQVITLNLDMDPGDWSDVKADGSYTLEVPAQFWADGESPILVSVRRKSADALGDKVSLKIDINEYVNQTWSGLKKLSLENGDDVDVVAEGFAWYLNRQAAAVYPSNYTPGLAAWVRLYVNGEYMGVYLNVEQPDKTFLKNRNIYTKGQTWLYKASDVNSYELKVGDPDSPTTTTLCYSPFSAGSDGGGKGKGKKGGGTNTDCAVPEDDAAMAAELNSLIDMDSMLTQGAVSAFTLGPDALFSKGKNFYYIDFAGEAAKRLYIPWDLDSVFVGNSAEGSIYGSEKKQRGKMVLSQSPYEEVILNNPEFRAQYDQIMANLLAIGGPLQVEAQIAFLDDLEVVLTSALQDDPNNNIDGSVAGRFASLRDWVIRRAANINQQLGN